MFKFLEIFARPFTSIHVPRTPGGPLYLSRYYLLGRLCRRWRDWLPFNLYLHHFHSSDVATLHDHPWSWALSLILAGGYIEHRGVRLPCSNRWIAIPRVFRPGDLNWISSRRLHYVTLRDDRRGYWTLVFSGPQWGRKWGFLVNGRMVESNEARRRGLVAETREGRHGST